MFADHIVEQIGANPASEKERMLREAIIHPRCIHIVADNIVQYLYHKYGSSLDTCKFYEAQADMFCLMAPSHQSWVEYSVKTARRPGRERDPLDRFSHLGTLIMFGPNNDSLWQWIDLPPEAQHLKATASWAIGLYHFLGSRRDFVTTNYSTWCFLDDKGVLIPFDEEGSSLLCSMHVSPESLIPEEGGPRSVQEVMSTVSQSAYELSLVPLYTIAMMNVRNVVMERQRRDPKLIKQRKKAGKPDYLRAYTLAIDVYPLGSAKTIYKAPEGEMVTSGSRTAALHQVRGHIADYRQNGLFGKHKGIFWIPSHHRGSSDKGFIDKVYMPEVAS